MNKSGGIIFMDDNEESRQMVEQCYQKNKTTINPIVDWTDEDVWEFLNDVAKVPHCKLYDEGQTRLGCIGCPLQGRDGMIANFERYPRYKELYIRAFDQMIKNHPAEIKVATGEPAEKRGEVLQYTKDGSLGTTPDGFANESVQATNEKSEEFTDYLSREREREGESTQPNRLINLPQQTVEAVRSRMERGVLDCQQPIVSKIQGQEMIEYWLWRCRPQNDWSPHPLGIPNKKLAGSNLDYMSNIIAENTIPTQE